MDEILGKVFKHKPHPHVPQNVNEMVKETPLNINERIALLVTNALGSMPCAYVFVVLAIIGFPGVNATPPQLVNWVSQTFIQLVALSILALGQTIQNRNTEMRNNQSYLMQVKTVHDVELMYGMLSDIKNRGADDGK